MRRFHRNITPKLVLLGIELNITIQLFLRLKGMTQARNKDQPLTSRLRNCSWRSENELPRANSYWFLANTWRMQNKTTRVSRWAIVWLFKTEEPASFVHNGQSYNALMGQPRTWDASVNIVFEAMWLEYNVQGWIRGYDWDQHSHYDLQRNTLSYARRPRYLNWRSRWSLVCNNPWTVRYPLYIDTKRREHNPRYENWLHKYP